MPGTIARASRSALRVVLAAAAVAAPAALYVVGRRFGDPRGREAPFWARIRGTGTG